MTKSSGLGDALFYQGYDLSGDVGSLSKVSGGPALIEVPNLAHNAMERLGGIRSGEIDFSAWYDSAAGQEHAVLLASMPRTDVIASYCNTTLLGAPAASIIAKESDIKSDRTAAGSLEDTITLLANAHGLEWCSQLTPGMETETAAHNGTAVDGGTEATAVAITGVSVANPTHITAVAHGLDTGDSVVIAGVAGTTPAVNGSYTVTVLDADHFTIPVNVTVGAGAGGTVTKTSTNYGLSAYLHVFAFTGTDATVKLQDSADNLSFADITGGAFTQITSGTPQAQRIETAVDATIREYVRAVVVTSGGFVTLTYAVNFHRFKVVRFD